MASASNPAPLLTLPPEPLSFPELLAYLYAHKYTGPLTLHFASGVPNALELPVHTLRAQLRRA